MSLKRWAPLPEPLHFELTQHNGTMSWDHITFEIFDGVTRKYSNKLECSAVWLSGRQPGNLLTGCRGLTPVSN